MRYSIRNQLSLNLMPQLHHMVPAQIHAMPMWKGWGMEIDALLNEELSREVQGDCKGAFVEVPRQLLILDYQALRWRRLRCQPKFI
jgi:hypothetical protein